jgi:alanine dehydrogenase
MGISDLSLGIALLDLARTAGAGQPVPSVVRQTPRLTR